MSFLKKAFLKLCPPIFLDLKKVLTTGRDNADSFYKIGDRSLRLPPGHTLEKYQRKHKLFDRFLPVIAQYIAKDKWAIDVGANVGDTAMMMLNSGVKKIICVEPSDKFYGYLEENLGSHPAFKAGGITLIKKLVGTGFVEGELVHYDGTAKVVSTSENVGQTSFIYLDDLIGSEPIAFVKVDTDGYDYDVLLSGKKVIARDQPILFWENQMENEDQSAGYDELYEFLAESGYDHLCIFDNFGGLMFENATFDVLRNLNRYILDMLENQTTRTLYFTDVLAYCSRDAERVHDALKDYKRKWIRS